jgi:hypothetical protein
MIGNGGPAGAHNDIRLTPSTCARIGDMSSQAPSDPRSVLRRPVTVSLCAWSCWLGSLFGARVDRFKALLEAVNLVD